MNWIHLSLDRGQWQALCEHGNERSGYRQGGESLD
jgi:hypothetical protein